MSKLHVGELRAFRERFGLTAFVETGCYESEGIMAALEAGFEQIFSCDISKERVEECASRFDGVAEIHLADSESFLNELLKRRLGRTLFWLDAHFPKFYGLPEDSGTRFPLQKELSLIARSKHNVAADVVLCDDMRVIASADNPRWRQGETSEYFTIESVSIAELSQPFSSTHCIHVDQQQEGILVITPLLVPQAEAVGPRV